LMSSEPACRQAGRTLKSATRLRKASVGRRNEDAQGTEADNKKY